MKTVALLLTLLAVLSNLPGSAAVNYPVVKGSVIFDPPSDKKFARRSEGAFITLKNGDIMHIYNRFKASYLDHASAELVKILISPDGKKVVSGEEVIVSAAKGGNVMLPSLLRLKDNRILMIYLEKERVAGTIVCRISMCYSADEGKTWSPRRHITRGPVYCVVLNGGAIQLANGRICIPVSQCRYKNDCNIDTCGVFYTLYSDDNGKSWKESASILFPPDRAVSNAGYQEPTMVEIANNELLLYMRSDLGYLWKSISKNGGVNWSTPELDKNFPEVVAPAKIKKLSGSRLVMFYNMNQNEKNPVKNSRDRSKLAMKTSKDNGKSWSKPVLLEPVTEKYYSYPELIETSDGAYLLSYYMYDKKIGSFWHLKIKRFVFDF